jgi:CspA family cold shock protein
VKDTSNDNGHSEVYNDQEGFGFIQPDNGSKYAYVHTTALERGGISAREGQKVGCI